MFCFFDWLVLFVFVCLSLFFARMQSIKKKLIASFSFNSRGCYADRRARILLCGSSRRPDCTGSSAVVQECGNREPLQDSKAQLRTHFLGRVALKTPSTPTPTREPTRGSQTLCHRTSHPHALSTPVSSYDDSLFAWSVFCSVKHWYFPKTLTLYFHANWGFVEDSLMRLPIKHFKA